MATGPGHYLEAERLTAQASAYEGLPGNAHIQDGQLAQVHATLAHAAATAFAAAMTAGEWPGWRDAAGSEETRRDGE